jgi:hypothetical protein
VEQPREQLFQGSRSLPYNLLLNYKAPPVLPRHGREHGDDEDALSFLQADDSNIPGNDGVRHDGVKCLKCNKYRHFTNHCPDEEGVTMLQVTYNTDEITLAPTGYAQGGYYFMSLVTELSRQQWDKLPTPEGVIAAVWQRPKDQPITNQSLDPEDHYSNGLAAYP